jgi:hypothetical protein
MSVYQAKLFDVPMAEFKASGQETVAELRGPSAETEDGIP